MLDNIQNVCRLCLSEEGLMLPIFQKSISKNETAFRYKIMSCASVEVYADDNLPLNVCHLCVHQIEKFFKFQAMCENSNAILHLKLKEKTLSVENHQDTSNDAADKHCSAKSCKTNSKTEFHRINERELRENTSFDNSACSLCSEIFLTNDSLVDHLLKTHSDVDSFSCKNCKMTFSDINKFKSHISLEHSFNCEHCDYVFKHHKNLQEHLKVHFKSSFSCKFCNKPFNNVFQMKNHELTHSEKSCRYCLKEFESAQASTVHFKECTQKYNCMFCEKSLELKKELIEHVNSCHSSKTDGRSSNHEKNFPKSFELEHDCESTSEHLIECKNCGANFADVPSLMTHISLEHSGEVLSCKFCTKKFSLRSSLKRHEKSHSGVKPYQCKFCPRKFKDSSALVVHTRTHTGEHPFQCQECDKDFKQLANLKMHTYRHHKKNQNSSEKNNEMLNSNHDFEHLYATEIVENYTEDNIREYQSLSENISNSFTQDMHLLIPDH